MSENGTIHITMMKNCVSHILFLRKGGGGAYRIPGSAEGGGDIRAAHPYYVIYESLSKFLSVSYLMKTADVIMNFFSSHNTTDHT